MVVSETIRRRLAVVGAAAFICVVGLVDASVPHVALSFFYVLPVFAAAWYGSATAAIAIPIVATCASLAADFATDTAPIYAFVNAGCRLLLFFLVAVTVRRLRRALDAERRAAETSRRLAEKERELNELRRERSHRVVADARVPLGEIYAKVVDLGFDIGHMSPSETAEVVSALASASTRVTALLDELETS